MEAQRGEGATEAFRKVYEELKKQMDMRKLETILWTKKGENECARFGFDVQCRVPWRRDSFKGRKEGKQKGKAENIK